MIPRCLLWWMPVLLFVWTSSNAATGKRLVFIPMPYFSHTNYLTNVARSVSKLGHQVWLTMPVYLAERSVLGTSGLQIIHYETDPDIEQRTVRVFSDAYFRGESENYNGFLRQTRENADILLRNSTFLDVIRRIDPDLIVIDNVPMMYILAIIPYRLGKPFAFSGSAYDPISIGVPFVPACTPQMLLPYSDNMTFFQRLATTTLWLVQLLYNPSLPEDAVATYAPEMPQISLRSLVTRAEIYLVEMDLVLDYPKPTVPNVKFVGGAAAGPAKTLPPEFKSFMDEAKEGVVVVSFGSYVLDIPADISSKLLDVFSKLPMRVVFRMNLTSPDPAKILTAAWLPQNDLLGHPNTRVFVSHCGKNGQYEALYHAVPVVATPLFADQPYNAERMRVKGLAEVLDLRTASAEDFEATILRVATEPRYKHAMIAASKLFRQQYKVPMEVAAAWLDHVMQYGGAYMRSASQEVSLYQYLLLDVLAVYLAIVLAVLTIVLCLTCCVLRLLTKKKRKTD